MGGRVLCTDKAQIHGTIKDFFKYLLAVSLLNLKRDMRMASLKTAENSGQKIAGWNCRGSQTQQMLRRTA